MLVFFLVLIFLLEGLGIQNGHEISYYLLIISPFFLLIFDKNLKIKIPKIFFILGLIFIVAIAISTFKSINIASSVGRLFLYPSLLFLSILAINNKTNWEGLLIKLMNYLSLFFVLISYLFLIFPQLSNGIINPKLGYSLIYRPDNFHNNLGDFLLMTIIINFYYWISSKTKKINWLLMALYIPIFFLSFSRSSLVALILVLIITIIFYRKKLKKTVVNNIVIILFHCLLFITITLLNRSGTFYVIYNFFHLTKDVLGGRESYLLEAIRSIKDYPIWGIGLGNFQMASFRYNDIIFWWSNTAHNLYLNIFTETGIISGISFLIITLSPLKKRIKDISFFIYLVLIFNFQLYYSYEFYGILIMFFIVLGLTYEEKSNYYLSKNVLLTLVIIPIIYIQLLTTSNILINKNEYRLANKFNPFNKKLYPYLIENSPDFLNFYDNAYYRNLYKKIFFSDSEVNEYLADINYRQGDKKIALEKLKTSLLWNPFGGDMAQRVNSTALLIKEVEGKEQAKRFIDNYTKRIKNMDQQKDYQQQYLNLINLLKY